LHLVNLVIRGVQLLAFSR